MVEEDEWGDMEGEDYSGYYGVEEEEKTVLTELQLLRQASVTRRLQYEVYSEKDLIARVNQIIFKAIELFGLTRDNAILILKSHKWNYSWLAQNYFDQMEAIYAKAGIIMDNLPSNEINCGICFDDLDEGNKDFLSCGHAFCKSCWKDYLSSGVLDGRSCIHLKCPGFKCSLSLPPSMVPKYLSKKETERYNSFIYTSYTEENDGVRWCPIPNCGHFAENPLFTPIEIKCKCQKSYCFGCSTEPHKPINCELTEKWKAKNTSESEDVLYLTANTKGCPKCKCTIEKNEGCNHMICSMCKHHFCWICMGPWSEHGENTGGFYNCNIYRAKAQKDHSLEEKKNQMEEAKLELERYAFYFERFINHDKSEKLANARVGKIEENISQISDIMNLPTDQIAFLRETNKCVIECRRFLKNSYVYGFYINNPKEKDLFEYMQKYLEENTDNLDELLQQPLDDFLTIESFTFFRDTFTMHYVATKKFYKNMADGLKQGLV